MAATRGSGERDATLPRGDAVRHPLKHAKHEFEHLHEVVDEGESPATPVILIAGLVLTLAPIAGLWIWAVLSLYNWSV
jgi:hypothetical protein